MAIGLMLAGLVACGSGSPAPTPMPPAERTATATAYQATATASAEAAELRKRPCLVDTETREILRLVSDTLWDAGTNVGSGNASLGLQYYEASIAYGLLTDCREVPGIDLGGATPVASPSPVAMPVGTPVGTPAACLVSPDDIAGLRDAASKGTAILFQLIFAGADAEDLAPLMGLNTLLIERAEALEIACGLRPPGTPVPEATSASTSWRRPQP
jgi:hypothetical protein